MLCAQKFSTVPPSGVTPRFRFYRCLENIHIQGRTHIYLNDHPPRQPSPNRQAESKINSHRGNTLWWVEILGIGFVEQGKETHGVPTAYSGFFDGFIPRWVFRSWAIYYVPRPGHYSFL